MIKFSTPPTLPRSRKDLPSARRGKRPTRAPKRSDGLAIRHRSALGAGCKALIQMAARAAALFASRASQAKPSVSIVARLVFSLAHESRIESRIALRGNYTLGGSQASENIALTRCGGLAMLQCVCLTTAHNIVCQCNASCGNFSLALLKALAQIVREHWHTAALFLKLFAASHCNSSCLRLSNIQVHGRN